MARARIIDGLAVLLGLSPLLILMAILTLLNPWINPGPLFFSQRRMGQGGREFSLVKFRSMSGDAAGAEFATGASDRISRLGRFLRRTHLDELPQLWNVARGQMSLIGPRPEQPAFHAHFGTILPCYQLRLLMRPGLTGLSQVRYGYADCPIGMQLRLAADLEYLRQRNGALDTWIIMRTFAIFLRQLAPRRSKTYARSRHVRRSA